MRLMLRSKRTRESEADDPPSEALPIEPTSSEFLSPISSSPSQDSFSQSHPDLSEIPLLCGLPATQPVRRNRTRHLLSNSPSTNPRHALLELHSGSSNQDLDEVDLAEVDPLEEIEIIDTEGRTRVTRGKINAADVWDLPERQRIKLHLNAMYQPIKKSAMVLSKWLASVAAKGDFCPVNISWPKISKMFGDKIIQLVRTKFMYPGLQQADIIILRMVNKRLREFKCDLKAEYFDPNGVPEQMISNVPEGVDPTQWAEVVQYWCSEKSKYLSQRAKEAREKAVHSHASGCKSFARLRDEFVLTHGREPRKLEWYQITCQRKDGTYVTPEAQEFVERAKALIAQRQQGRSDCSDGDSNLEDEVFDELYVPPKPRHIPFDHYGPAKSGQIIFDDSRSTGHLSNGSNYSGLIEKLQVQIETMKKTYEATCCKYEDRFQKFEERIQQLESQQSVQIVQSVCDDLEESDDDVGDFDSSDPEDTYSEHGASNTRRTM